MVVFPGDHYTVTVGAGGAAAKVATGTADGSSGTAPEIRDPTTTELVFAGGGAGGAHAANTCISNAPPPPPAAAGGVYSAFAGVLLPNGSCQAVMIRVDPCGVGGTAATYTLSSETSTPAGPGDNGQVILEW